jgi:hypothetical protein
METSIVNITSSTIFGFVIIVLAIVFAAVGLHKSRNTTARYFDICASKNALGLGL